MISLTLISKGEQKDISLTRTARVFSDKRVSTEVITSKDSKKIAMVNVPSFYGRGGMNGLNNAEQSSSEDLESQITKINQKPSIDAVVLDLRGNPGGYLEEAVQMAGMFLGKQTVVGVKDQEAIQKMESEENLSPLFKGPLIVWVDEETASAGEVLAAALKDYQRALLVGTPSTYGKGSVQKLFQIDDPFLNLGIQSADGVIKLTTSLFYSPLGHSPANGGVSTHLALVASKDVNENKMKVNDIEPRLDDSELEKLKKTEPEFQKVIDQIDINMNQESDLRSRVTEIAARFSNLSQIH
jgi:carboxyl-terminal processing protease